MVLSNIAQYESGGLRVDNDLGQRGLALSGFFILVISVLALLSIRYLIAPSVAGFVLHAAVWFALLLLGISTWLVFGRELGGIAVVMLLLCLVGTVYAALCARLQKRFSRNPSPHTLSTLQRDWRRGR